MNDKTEQMKAVLSDEAFVNALLDAENEEAVQKMLADKGVEMSLTEIEIMGEMMVAAADGKITLEQMETLSKAGELSEEDLASIAGGRDSDAEIVQQVSEAIDKAFHNGPSKLKIAGGVVGGVIVAAGAAYGICKAVGVDVDGGIASAFSWCKEKITSRW